jgi:hypothetical protein
MGDVETGLLLRGWRRQFSSEDEPDKAAPLASDRRQNGHVRTRSMDCRHTGPTCLSLSVCGVQRGGSSTMGREVAFRPR